MQLHKIVDGLKKTEQAADERLRAAAETAQKATSDALAVTEQELERLRNELSADHEKRFSALEKQLAKESEKIRAEGAAEAKRLMAVERSKHQTLVAAIAERILAEE